MWSLFRRIKKARKSLCKINVYIYGNAPRGRGPGEAGAGGSVYVRNNGERKVGKIFPAAAVVAGPGMINGLGAGKFFDWGTNESCERAVARRPTAINQARFVCSE